MTAINVKAIPEDLARFVLKIQGQIRSQKCSAQFSQSQAVLHIIREYKKMMEK